MLVLLLLEQKQGEEPQSGPVQDAACHQLATKVWPRSGPEARGASETRGQGRAEEQRDWKG